MTCIDGISNKTSFNFRVASSVVRNNLSKRGGRANHPKSPGPPIKVTETHTTVTLDDIKSRFPAFVSTLSNLSFFFHVLLNILCLSS